MNHLIPTLIQRGEFCFHVEGRRPQRFKNSGTLAGLEHLIRGIFLSGPTVTNWYLGLIDDTDWNATSVNDTAGSHADWIEFVGYKYANVVQRAGPLTLSASKDSGTPPFLQMTFEGSANGIRFTTTGKVRGMFLTNAATQESTSGLLFSTGIMFPGSDVTPGDTATISYRWIVNGIANSKAMP